MNPTDPADLLRQALDSPPRAEATPECLDDDTLAALAEESLDPRARLAVMLHLATCSRCRSVVASVSRMLADTSVAREVAASEGRTWRRFYRIALPIAAAAVLVILALPRLVIEREPPHRAPTITAGTVPAPVSPMGTVAEAKLLRWASVAGADRYRVTLFDADGKVVYETLLADTVAALPVVLSPGRRYLWKVEARIGFDRWTASELIEFTMGRGVPR